MTRIELVTSSLPRKRSTPELHRRSNKKVSGRRDSNSRRSAWKADALPTELLPLNTFVSVCGESRIRTCEGVHQQIYSLPSLAAWVSPQHWADGGIRTPDQLITNQLLWPTELHRLVLFECWIFIKCWKNVTLNLRFGIANVQNFFLSQRVFEKIYTNYFKQTFQ